MNGSGRGARASEARLGASPRRREGRTRGRGPGQLGGLTCSCWLRPAAATASRAAASTFVQRLRVPPRPPSPRLPEPPPPGGQSSPAEPRPPPRGPPWSPAQPPPGPRAASPVRREQVEESQRVSPQTRKPASKGARPPALPPPAPTPVFSSSSAPSASSSRAVLPALRSPRLPRRFLLLSLLPLAQRSLPRPPPPRVSCPSSRWSSASSRASPLRRARPGGPGPRLLSSLRLSRFSFLLLLLFLKRILWPQIASKSAGPPQRLPPLPLLPPKSEAHARGNQKLRPRGVARGGEAGRGARRRPQTGPSGARPGAGRASAAQSLDLA